MRNLILLGTFCSVVSTGFAQVWVEGTSQPSKRITVSSPAEEIVQDVKVIEGDKVVAGQILATLFSTREQLEVKRLGFMIDKAAEDVKTAKELFEKQIQSKSNLIEKEAELKRLMVEQEMAQFAIDERTIKSPLDGTVSFRLKDQGEAIGRLEPLFEVIDASKIKLAFFLPPKYLLSVKKGMEAEVAFPELPELTGLKARLNFIDSQLDARSGLFRIRFEFDNSKLDVIPGLRVRVKLPEPEGNE